MYYDEFIEVYYDGVHREHGCIMMEFIENMGVL